MAAEQADNMIKRVLVAYATRYGSTREVAEAIATTLRAHGLSVDVTRVNEVRGLDEYRSVVLGAPFYLGSWDKDARRFIEEHRDELAMRPVAIFALGPTRPDDDMAEAREQLDDEMAKYPWLQPVATEMFGGKYDPAKLNFSHRLLTLLPASPLHGMPASDLRDWAAIDRWADDLAETLERPAM